MSEDQELAELTIEDVSELANEYGYYLVMHGDTYALGQHGVVRAVGTLVELYEVLETLEVLAIQFDKLSPTGVVIH